MKKVFVIILGVCLLAGCALASPGTAGSDELTGFLVTVSLKDGDTVTDLWNEEAAGMEPINLHYLKGQKLYARRIEGDPVRYEFPEGCGLSCFSYDVFADDPNESYRSNTISREIDVRLEYHAGSTTAYRMDAVLYGTEDTNAIIEMNPVYQTPDGEVYVLSDEPASFEVATMDGCSSFLTQEAAADKGYTTYQGSTVKLTIQHVVLPEVYVIIEMDEHNQPLRQIEYAPGDLPETYTPGADAAYLILEAQDGENTVRSVYSPADASDVMDTYYPGQYGLCIKGYTRIQWEGME